MLVALKYKQYAVRIKQKTSGIAEGFCSSLIRDDSPYFLVTLTQSTSIFALLVLMRPSAFSDRP